MLRRRVLALVPRPFQTDASGAESAPTANCTIPTFKVPRPFQPPALVAKNSNTASGALNSVVTATLPLSASSCAGTEDGFAFAATLEELQPAGVPITDSTCTSTASTLEARGYNAPVARKAFALARKVVPTLTAGCDADAPGSTKYYNVMYTKQSNKKHKTYDDGILTANGKVWILLDMEGKQVAKTHSKETVLSTGCPLSFGRYEGEVMGVVDDESFESGRVFISKSSPSPLQAVAATSVLPPTKSSLGRGDTVIKSAANEATPSKMLLAKSASSAKVLAPRHDPSARGALVLQLPPAGSPGVAVVVDPVLANHLRPHQREGVAFMWECLMGVRMSEGHGCILADDMGLGKTLQTISVIWTMLKQHVTSPPAITKALVVCPSSLVNNWRAEFKKWLGDERCKPLAMNKQGAEAAGMITDFLAGSHTVHPVLIISYEMLRKHIALLSAPANNIGLLVCDEAHRLKSAAGNKTIAALASISTTRRLLLTGTPVQNNLEELYAMVNFCNPGILGALNVFKRVFQTPIIAGREKDATKTEMSLGSERSAELSRQLAQFVVRRTSEILEKILPPKVEYIVFCRLSKIQAGIYRRLTVSRSAVHDPSNPAVLLLLNHLRKLCVHPDLLLQRSKLSDCEEIPTFAAIPAKALDVDATDIDHDDELPAAASDLERSVTSDVESSGSESGVEPLKVETGVTVSGFKRPRSELHHVYDSGESKDVQTVTRSMLPAGYPADVLGSLDSGPALDYLLQFSTKLQFLDELLQSIRKASADKVVLISNYTQVLDVFESLCKVRSYKFLRLDGSTPSDKRQALVNQFNATYSDSSVFLLSSQAGGVGLNLIGANRLVLFDPSWNPAIDKQALARVWRDGQKKYTFIYRVFAANTIEEKVLQRQLLKQDYAMAAGQQSSKQSKASSGKFSRAELRELFSMDPESDACCDTFKVMSTSTAGDSTWPSYKGHHFAEDPALQAACESHACREMITYVQATHFNRPECISLAAADSLLKADREL